MDVITRSKRRRLNLEEESWRRQQPPVGPGADEGGESDAAAGPDLLSGLPDDVLGDVIALLPIKDGARTQVLSRRWRPLWCAAPLNFTVTAVVEKNRVSATVRTHDVLASSPVSLRRRERFSGSTVVDNLLRSPIHGCLRELELHDATATFVCYRNGCRRKPPPPSLFRVFSPAPGPGMPGFRELNRLTLRSVNISETRLHGIVSGCPSLQSLVLVHNVGYRRLRIASSTLRSLAVTDGYKCREGTLQQVTIEYAPMLERLILNDLNHGLIHIRNMQAPKLKVLGHLYPCHSHHPRLKLETMVFKERCCLSEKRAHLARSRTQKRMELVSLNNAMRTVKVLALTIAAPSLDVVIDMLQCFPCVEKLHIKVPILWEKLDNNVCRRDTTSLECLHAHLKMLQLTPPSHGNKSEEVVKNLISFFLLNARVLESMTLVVHGNKYSDAQWKASKRKELQLHARASSQAAHFDFEPDRSYYDARLRAPPMKHIHNLAVDDPFGY